MTRSPHDLASQHDARGRSQHGQVLAGVPVVDDKIGRGAFVEGGVPAEPLPGPPRGGPQRVGGRDAELGHRHDLSGGRDGYVQLIPFARTDGLNARFGGELTLYWLGGYGGGVFLPFRDATTGRTTFGGGRYLLDGIKGADLGMDAWGRAILDFNFAYNPSCAYSARWICPLAPPENALPVAITAGERMPA